MTPISPPVLERLDTILSQFSFTVHKYDFFPNSSFSKISGTFFLDLSTPHYRHPITIGTTTSLCPPHLYLISKAKCWYFVHFAFALVSIFCSCWHVMSQIQIILLCLSSNVKCGRPGVADFRKRNSKPHTNFAILFSTT